MRKNDSTLFHLSVGIVANVLAFYITRWLSNERVGTPSISLALQVLVWIVAVAVSIWCLDWLIRRADRWLANRYFRRGRPHRLSMRARELHLKAELFSMYGFDNEEHMRSFYEFKRKWFEEGYDKFADEVKDSCNIILPDYSDPVAAAKALAKADGVLSEIRKQQEANRFIRFLPSNLTIKRRK